MATLLAQWPDFTLRIHMKEQDIAVHTCTHEHLLEWGDKRQADRWGLLVIMPRLLGVACHHASLTGQVLNQ